jgi:hypothetical protein
MDVSGVVLVHPDQEPVLALAVMWTRARVGCGIGKRRLQDMPCDGSIAGAMGHC